MAHSPKQCRKHTILTVGQEYLTAGQESHFPTGLLWGWSRNCSGINNYSHRFEQNRAEREIPTLKQNRPKTVRKVRNGDNQRPTVKRVVLRGNLSALPDYSGV